MTRPRPAPRTSCLLDAPSPRRLAVTRCRIGTTTALAWTICLASACGGEPEDVAPEPAAPLAASASAEQHAGAAADHRAAQARARVDALLAEPTPQHLLAVLAQSHADARALLGPHRLRYKASFTLTPEAPARPVVDEPVQLEQRVVDELVLAPKPLRRPRPTLYAGGESEAAKRLIAGSCDAYVMHGDPPERIAPKIADMRRRRAELGLPAMQYGLAAYVIVRASEAEARRELDRITDVSPGSPGYHNYQDWIAHTQLEQQVSLHDYSVSNRGLRAGLVGTPEQVAARIHELAVVGVDLLLLQCSPQLEEMERLGADLIPLLR